VSQGWLDVSEVARNFLKMDRKTLGVLVPSGCLNGESQTQMASVSRELLSKRSGRIERLKKLLERICLEQAMLLKAQDQLVEEQTNLMLQNQATLDTSLKELRDRVHFLEIKDASLRAEQEMLHAQQASLREQQDLSAYRQRELIEDQRKISASISERHAQIKETFSRVQELTKEMDNLIGIVKWEEAEEAK